MTPISSQENSRAMGAVALGEAVDLDVDVSFSTR